MSLLDVLGLMFAEGPSAPDYALFASDGAVSVDRIYGAPSGDSFYDGLTVSVPPGGKILCPVNAQVRKIPILEAGGPLQPITAEQREKLLAELPELRHGDGSLFGLDQMASDDLILDMWPAAFRRLEQLIASLEFAGSPEPPAALTPALPAPRYFWIRGVGQGAQVRLLLDSIERQFPGRDPVQRPDGQAWHQGQVAVFVAAGQLLEEVQDIEPHTFEIRAFDQRGLAIDPNYVFSLFAELSRSVAAPSALFAKPGGPLNWPGPKRHVFQIADHVGAPYKPWRDHPLDPVPPDEQLNVAILGNANPFSVRVPPNGLVVIDAADPNYNALTDHALEVRLNGEHVRLAPEPHGVLDQREPLSAARAARLTCLESSFFRLRAIDYAQWFPRRQIAGPTQPLTPDTGVHNSFARYHEGNEMVPIADGEIAFREIYRALRQTYVDETYRSDNHLPRNPPRPAAQNAGTLALLNNWNMTPQHVLLGLRAMTETPRTQDPALIPEDPADLLANLVLIPARGAPSPPVPNPEPDQTDSSSPATNVYYRWVARPGTLPPGAWVELRQLGVQGEFYGKDDPRYPGTQAADDLFGIVTTPRGGRHCWVASDGSFSLDVVFQSAHGSPQLLREANLRVIYWEADEDDEDPAGLDTSGKGAERTRAYGQITIPFPADPLAPERPPIPGVNPSAGMSLEWNETPGEARVVLAAGVLGAPKSVLVMNSRTGETTRADDLAANPNGVREIILSNFARNDVAVIAFVDTPAETVADASQLFQVSRTAAQKAGGSAPVHPLEIAGALREAITAGVDVRALVWDNTLEKNPVEHFAGTAAAINLSVNGNRGLAIADAFVRPAGAHHQKPIFLRTPTEIVSYVGGLDQKSGRYDSHSHRTPDPKRPNDLWHDIHTRLAGRAAWDVYRNFQQRWNTTLTHREPLGQEFTPLPDPASADLDDSSLTRQDGPVTVQVNRTYPRLIEESAPFVNTNHGDLSILASYERVFDIARDFLYIEDQYFFNVDFARKLNRQLRDGKLRWIAILLPKKLSEFPGLDAAFYAVRAKAVNMLLYGQESVDGVADPTNLAGYVGDRAVVFHRVNEDGEPVYIHCKCIIADDVWVTIGSSNLNRRSMTYDTEINAAGIDTRILRGGHRIARDFRVSLMAEHLRLLPDQEPLLDNPHDAFRLLKAALDGELTYIKHGVIPYDARQTHFGEQPPEYDQTLQFALDMIIDPDGRQDATRTSLSGLLGLINTLQQAEGDNVFGGVATVTLRLNVPVAAGFDASVLRARAELFGPNDNGATVFLSAVSFEDVTQSAVLGFAIIGSEYQIRVTVFADGAPETTLADATDTFTVNQPAVERTVNLPQVS